MEKKYSLNTEVGLLAVWDPVSLNFINSENYENYFASNQAMVDLMNQGGIIVWGTGGDGRFNITVRIGENVSLDEKEKELVEMKAENLRFETNGNIYLGSPEFIGDLEAEGLEQPQIFNIEELHKGVYLTNLYFIYDSEAIEMMDSMTNTEIDEL